ncbi:MAG: type I-E CRISPR-associated protein Cse1/CasA [Anaerolineae bacterium]|nr:type I-E CRISPR-associated protein Cse1/CasA [Anaerolineae bacterium]
MAHYSFNLIDGEWIPCIMLDGTTREFGLLETLARAHEVEEVFDPSPLITASLHRLLLAILHRNFGPASIQEWRAIWEVGHFDGKALQDYFGKWHNRFDLFDEEHPFYQMPTFHLSKKTPLKKLAPQFAVQHNCRLFDHSTDNDRSPFPAKTAALWLLATQAFSPTGGKSATIHTKDSPWARGAFILIAGDNLFQTLMLNLIPRPFLPGEIQEYGKPSWECEDPGSPKYEILPRTYLEYMTLQSRWIKLIVPEDSSSPNCVRECFLAQGKAISEDFKVDPLLAYEKSRDGKRMKPWALKKGRATWRDSSALLNISNNVFRPPLSSSLLRKMVKSGVLKKDYQYRLNIYGQNLDPGQAKINFWRHERMPLPLDYLADEDLVEDLQHVLDKAESAGSALNSALWRFGASILPSPGGKPNSGELRKFCTHLGGDGLFWSRLEAPFYQLLPDLPKDREKTIDGWLKTLRHIAWGAFEEATRDVDQSARTLRALIGARQTLGNALSKLSKE